jgi:hypothetical protein
MGDGDQSVLVTSCPAGLLGWAKDRQGVFDRPRGIKQHRLTIVQVDYSPRGQGGLPVRHRAADLGRRLVLAQTLIDHLAQQIVIGPGQKLDLGDQLGGSRRPRRKSSASRS